jgi:hypothetical protein
VSLLKVVVSTKTTALRVRNPAVIQLAHQLVHRPALQAVKQKVVQVTQVQKSLQTKPKPRAKQKAKRKPKRKLAQPKANNLHTWPLAMQTKLIDQWYALCRDASRQRFVIISLSILSTLFYLVTALGFTSSSGSTISRDIRYEIPAGFRAVAMQSVGPLPDVRAGDFVDVIIDATVALDRVLVIDVLLQPSRSETIVLAIPVASAPQIADAAALGIVALVLVG